MTQDELAKKTGYTDRSSIAKIERGDVDLPQSKIILFAKALNISAGELMGNSGITSPSLSSDETDLLSCYRQLNQAGKDLAYIQVQNLTQIPVYTKRELSAETGIA